MFWNNVKIAIRNLRKNKLFAAINISGLAIGLTIYVFGGLLVKYEGTHDAFFEKSERTYTVGVHASPELDVGFDKFGSVFTAAGPLLEAELSDIEAVARTISYEYLITLGADSFYQMLRFADSDLLTIFDFEYIHGNASALDDPTGILISESSAIKYFGTSDVIGETITLNNQFDFHVTAVIKDVPQNSHFTSLPIMNTPFNMLGSIKSLGRLRDYDEAGEWNNLSLGNMTYVLLPPGLDGDWLQRQANSMFDRLVPEEQKDVIESFWITPLEHANLAIWDTLGMPVVLIISVLSFLVLVIACVNYTNLATAQSLGRSREVGMRKTMGAAQSQLLVQFLIESMVIATIAMLVAIAILEVLVPLFNNAANKVMTLDYLQTLPWLLVTTLLVGLFAGAYPAWLITRASPIDALRETARKGKKGATMRSFMIGAQFAISAFMLAIVAVIYMQNEQVKESSYEFPRAEIYNLGRVGTDGLANRLDTLRHELEALPNVDSVAYSSQVPYEQSNSTTYVAMNPGDEAGRMQIQLLRFSPEFLETYDIPLLAGRGFNRDIANDEYTIEESEVVNVLINELALEQFGFATPEEALNQRFYDLDEDDLLREMIIVGVVPTQNIVGLFNPIKPWMFFYQPESFRIASLRITRGDMLDTVAEIEEVWKRVIPEYPVQGRFLDDVFEESYQVLKYMNMALAGFAFIALSLALIGLFGLAAFMAAQRTKEIGVRKVLGASSVQIARLLVWQFSKPVMWALAIALPVAFFASKQYLDFFAERIDAPIVILLVAGAIAVVLAWTTVAAHAFRIARANPVLALRYE